LSRIKKWVKEYILRIGDNGSREGGGGGVGEVDKYYPILAPSIHYHIMEKAKHM